MITTIPHPVARMVAASAHHHDWLVGTTRAQQSCNGWIQTSITSMSIYPTIVPTINVRAQDVMLTITAGCTTISIDMRLGAHDFTDAINQAFDDISR